MNLARLFTRPPLRSGAVAALAVLLVARPASGADVSVYALIKNRSFSQTNTSAPVLATSNAFSFVAVVDAAVSNVTSATLRLPSLVTNAFTNTPGVGPFGISKVFPTQSAMDSNVASGSYQFTINAVHDGTKTPSLTLTGDTYANVPMITNFNEAQLIPAEVDFTLRWDPFIGGNAQDNIVLTVRRTGGPTVFSTPVFGQPGALDGTVTSYLIPSNTLAVGQNYSASLVFANVGTVDLFSYGGITLIVPGVPAYSSTTDFKMRTLSVPVLTITNLAGNVAQLGFNADSGREYDLRASVDLENWASLLITNAAGATVTYPDTNSPGFQSRYYRLQDP